MRKKVIGSGDTPESRSEQWLELGELATIEITSEDPNFPIESALTSGKGPGWRAAERGKHIIRIIFDRPRPLHRIDSSFRKRKLSELRNSVFSGQPSRAGRLARSLVNSGPSAREARRTRSRTIRSI